MLISGGKHIAVIKLVVTTTFLQQHISSFLVIETPFLFYYIM
jgi:hypothetical protein